MHPTEDTITSPCKGYENVIEELTDSLNPMQAQQAASAAELERSLLHRRQDVLMARAKAAHSQLALEFATTGEPFPMPTTQQLFAAVNVVTHMTPTELAEFDKKGHWRQLLVDQKAKLTKAEAEVASLKLQRAQDDALVRSLQLEVRSLQAEVRQDATVIKDLARQLSAAEGRDRASREEVNNVRLAAGTATLDAARGVMRRDITHAIESAAVAAVPAMAETLMARPEFVDRLAMAVRGHVVTQPYEAARGLPGVGHHTYDAARHQVQQQAGQWQARGGYAAASAQQYHPPLAYGQQQQHQYGQQQQHQQQGQQPQGGQGHGGGGAGGSRQYGQPPNEGFAGMASEAAYDDWCLQDQREQEARGAGAVEINDDEGGGGADDEAGGGNDEVDAGGDDGCVPEGRQGQDADVVMGPPDSARQQAPSSDTRPPGESDQASMDVSQAQGGPSLAQGLGGGQTRRLGMGPQSRDTEQQGGSVTLTPTPEGCASGARSTTPVVGRHDSSRSPPPRGTSPPPRSSQPPRGTTPLRGSRSRSPQHRGATPARGSKSRSPGPDRQQRVASPVLARHNTSPGRAAGRSKSPRPAGTAAIPARAARAGTPRPGERPPPPSGTGPTPGELRQMTQDEVLAKSRETQRRADAMLQGFRKAVVTGMEAAVGGGQGQAGQLWTREEWERQSRLNPQPQYGQPQQSQYEQQQQQQQRTQPLPGSMPPPPAPARQHEGRDASPQSSSGKRARAEKSEIYTLPDGRSSLILDPPPHGAKLSEKAGTNMTLEDEDFPYLPVIQADAIKAACLTPNQQQHATWACRFTMYRGTVAKRGWDKWKDFNSPTAWELIADARHAWPEGETVPFTEYEAGQRSYSRWTFPEWRARPQQPSDPVQALRDVKIACRARAEKPSRATSRERETGGRPGKAQKPEPKAPSGRTTPAPRVGRSPPRGQVDAADLQAQISALQRQLNARRQPSRSPERRIRDQVGRCAVSALSVE